MFGDSYAQVSNLIRFCRGQLRFFQWLLIRILFLPSPGRGTSGAERGSKVGLVNSNVSLNASEKIEIDVSL